MKFRLKRASRGGQDSAEPMGVVGAVPESYWATRTQWVKTQAPEDGEMWPYWRSLPGRNHRYAAETDIYGHPGIRYFREIQATRWTIEIERPEDLMDLQREVGQWLIVDAPAEDDPARKTLGGEITIHDDYVE